ncbi:MAG: DUF5606 domain-containing protein [Bacteroidia bacterium]|nr:DUF5606 domain-containing protein [Bacteroidia bacterium]MBP9689595.1 DUF5606 domain-containing protein [Bacteroidia bacterium]
MNLREIVAISGVGGLHKIIGRTKTGLILESLNETKKRFPTSIQDKVSVLEDISMYTEDGDMRLAEVFVKLNENGKVPTSKDDVKTLRKFLVDVIKLDSERVYDSDIKKLITWYNALKDIVDFKALLAEQQAEEAEAIAAEEAEEAPKKTAKKTSKKDETGDEAEVEKPKKVAAKKAAAPKKTTTAKTVTPKPTKLSNKTASSTNTYRPKSV